MSPVSTPYGTVVAGVLVHHDADRLRRVTRRGEDLEGDLAEHEPLPVVQRLDRELDVGALAVGDDGAGRRGQLEVAAEEVGVDVGLDHPLDRQPLGGCLLEVHVDVAPRIDDHGATRRLVTDQVRGVREARQVVLREDHRPARA